MARKSLRQRRRRSTAQVIESDAFWIGLICGIIAMIALFTSVAIRKTFNTAVPNEKINPQ